MMQGWRIFAIPGGDGGTVEVIMRIGKMWSVGLAMLLALGTVALAQGGEHRGPTGGAQGDRPGHVRSGRGELKVYFVDVEGGQSTLFVMPGGESLLVDTGSADPRNPTAPRDASRIAAVCKLAGVTKIDYLVVTHYHSDHVGGLPQLVGMIRWGGSSTTARTARAPRCRGARRRLRDTRRTRRCWRRATRSI